MLFHGERIQNYQIYILGGGERALKKIVFWGGKRKKPILHINLRKSLGQISSDCLNNSGDFGEKGCFRKLISRVTKGYKKLWGNGAGKDGKERILRKP